MRRYWPVGLSWLVLRAKVFVFVILGVDEIWFFGIGMIWGPGGFVLGRCGRGSKRRVVKAAMHIQATSRRVRVAALDSEEDQPRTLDM